MKKVVIIGAGIAGLSAAIYAKRSGFDVTLCEQHNIAGGMCTSWKRKGYLFEGAVHWLTGSSPNTEIYQLWKETGALGVHIPVLLEELFSSVEWEGKIINLYRDIERTAKHLIEISPEDKKQIKQLVKNVKAFTHFQIPVTDMKGVKAQNPKRMKLSTILKMMPAFFRFAKLSKITSKEYAMKFKHQGIQNLLFSIVGYEYTALSLIVTLSTLNVGDGGYPEGGSLPMINRMVKTYESIGGKLLLKTPVKKVRIENNVVTGVLLENGTTLEADAVIVTQETFTALQQLFETPPQDQWLKNLSKNTKPAVCTFIGVGIRCELPEPKIPIWKLETPITYAGRTETVLGFNNYSKYEGYAPKGCSTLTTAFMGDTYDFWKKAKEEGRYEQEKKLLADQISRAICRKFPQAEGNIEVIDIATPLTYERYTNSYHGSWMSVSGVGDSMKIYPGFSQSINGLYFAGFRIMPPGGLPSALYSGRMAAQLVCRQFGTIFVN